MGVILGDGWWRGSSGLMGVKNNFGYKLAFLGQLMLTYADGSRETVVSDGSFKTTTGPILKSDLKAGEVYDARLSMPGWDSPGFDDSAWKPVHVTKDSLEVLTATRSVPVKGMERFIPKILNTPNGETVLDFGQNIAGWVEMDVEGPAGTEVTLIHGETLDKDGNFTLKNLTLFKPLVDFQEVHYIAGGKGPEHYRPHFGIFGFRYVLVKGWPGKIKPENFTSVSIYSAMEQTGSFTCSNPLINQLVVNTIWSQKGNFLEVPTDCPTRERGGWSGDAQVFCRTASYLMNVYPFFEKWMTDLALEQQSNGTVTNTIPDAMKLHNKEEVERMRRTHPNGDGMMTMDDHMDGSAGWGDAAVIIPWTMYLCYGDRNILERQYKSAKAWVDYMDACAKDANEHYKDTPAYHNYTDGELDANYIWDTRFHWGEWLEADETMPDVPPPEPGKQPKDPSNPMDHPFAKKFILSDPPVATAYYAYSTRLFAEMASILGKTEDAAKYRARAEKIRRIYDRYFIRENGEILGDRQAPNVRTLAFNLASEEKKQPVARVLSDLARQKDYHLNTGFLSTPFILPVLAEHGYPDTAYRLLEQDTCPSWLYAVTKGATTIWESWNGITPDGNTSGSLNHYSYGAVCDFLFSYVCGIRPVMEEPGYKHFVIKPLPGGTLTFAKARFDSPYGPIESGWEKLDGGTVYKFTVPANTTASVMLPGSEASCRKLKADWPDATYENGRVLFTAGSGSYQVTFYNQHRTGA